MNASEDHKGAAGTRETTDVIPAKRIGRMNANPDDIAAADRLRVEGLERLVNDVRRTVPFRRHRGEDVLPARRDHSGAERYVAWIDKMNTHQTASECVGETFAESGEGCGGCQAAFFGTVT
jgi:hypothetical protein